MYDRFTTSLVLVPALLHLLLAGGFAGDDRLVLTPGIEQRCLRVLREGLKSEEFWPSMHAAEALTLAGHGDEVRQHLLPLLPRETDDQRRCGLARELVRGGARRYAGIMIDILNSPNPHGHVHAAESLYKVNELGDGTAMRRAFARDNNIPQKLMAAGALGRCGNPHALAYLRQKLTDGDEDESRIAIWLLGSIGDASDIPRIRERWASLETPIARAYAEHALAVLGDADGLQALARNLTSDDPAIRTYAATFAGDARAVSAVAILAELLMDPVLDVRVRAAQSLLVLSQPAPPDRHEEIAVDVYPATPENPRYSEGSILVHLDGRLEFAITEFFETASDFAQARIISRTSTDGGRTWSEPRVLQENTGSTNVMSVTLRRLGDEYDAEAPLGMFYLQKNSKTDLQVLLRTSNDEFKTLSEPIAVTARAGYHVLNNDRVTRLSNGRLLVPVASTTDVGTVNHFVCTCWISDDNGQTWRESEGAVDLPKRGAMEPEVLQLDGKRVLMIIRTQLGYIAASTSEDGGNKWGEPVDWNVEAPEAPSTLRRIPSTGDLLLVWNNTHSEGADHGGKRTPLTAAISPDEGRTWSHVRNLETRADQAYAYTSLTFVGDRALLSYYVAEAGKLSTRFRSLPVSWFYATPDPE